MSELFRHYPRRDWGECVFMIMWWEKESISSFFYLWGLFKVILSVVNEQCHSKWKTSKRWVYYPYKKMIFFFLLSFMFWREKESNVEIHYTHIPEVVIVVPATVSYIIYLTSDCIVFLSLIMSSSLMLCFIYLFFWGPSSVAWQRIMYNFPGTQALWWAATLWTWL